MITNKKKCHLRGCRRAALLINAYYKKATYILKSFKSRPSLATNVCLHKDEKVDHNQLNKASKKNKTKDESPWLQLAHRTTCKIGKI